MKPRVRLDLQVAVIGTLELSQQPSCRVTLIAGPVHGLQFSVRRLCMRAILLEVLFDCRELSILIGAQSLLLPLWRKELST